MNQERLLTLISAPHVTEKTARAAETGNQYVFKVLPQANKLEIKAAIEAAFDVTVEQVRVINVKGKTKRVKTGLGKRNNWKKAYVSLAEGQSIELAAAE